MGGAAQGSADDRKNYTTALIHRARELELIPPVRSAPRRLELPGVEGNTSLRGAR